jgi:hypothetical protein
MSELARRLSVSGKTVIRRSLAKGLRERWNQTRETTERDRPAILDKYCILLQMAESGRDSNPSLPFGICKLQVLRCRDCHECRLCRCSLHAIARSRRTGASLSRLEPRPKLTFRLARFTPPLWRPAPPSPTRCWSPPAVQAGRASPEGALDHLRLGRRVC